MQLSSELQTPPRSPVPVAHHSWTAPTRKSEGRDLPPQPGTAAAAGDGRTPGSPRREVRVRAPTARPRGPEERARPPLARTAPKSVSSLPGGLPQSAVLRGPPGGTPGSPTCGVGVGAAGSAFAKGQGTSAKAPSLGPCVNVPPGVFLGFSPRPQGYYDGVLDDLSPGGVSMATLRLCLPPGAILPSG